MIVLWLLLYVYFGVDCNKDARMYSWQVPATVSRWGTPILQNIATPQSVS